MEREIKANNYEIDRHLHKTDDKRSDIVDAYAYMMAGKMMKLREDYILLYIKKRPKWLPEILYRWIIGKVVCIAEMK